MRAPSPPAISPTCRSASGPWSRAGSSASSPTLLGAPAYKLPPEANLMALAPYLDALAWQRDVAALHAIFGGKNPHPHFLVGGAPNPIDLESDSAINAKRLAQVQDIIVACGSSWTRCTSPTRSPSPAIYKDWRPRRRAGQLPSASATSRPGRSSTRPVHGAARRDPSGRDLSHIEEVDPERSGQIQ